MAATLRINGQEYDVEKDFSWAELMLVEELSGVPLGSNGAFDSMAVLGACVFIVLKREDESLTWEQFVKRPMDVTDTRDEPEQPAAKRAAKKRPPKPAA